MTLGEYGKAEAAFQEVCDLTPQDYRGWWGRVCAMTHNFEFFPNSFEFSADLNRYYKAACSFASEKELSIINKKMIAYNIAMEEHIQIEQEERNREKDKYASGYVFSEGLITVSEESMRITNKRASTLGFGYGNIKRIIIPESVRTIGDNAFFLP